MCCVWFVFLMKWDGMTSGDCWVFYVTSAQVVYLGDMFSSGLSQPSYDASQDLTVVSGWNDGSWSVVEFTRLLNTGDATDKLISPTPGTPIRFMWTYGLSAVGTGGRNAPAATGALTKLGMHGYIGKAGQEQHEEDRRRKRQAKARSGASRPEYRHPWAKSRHPCLSVCVGRQANIRLIS